VPQFLQNLSLPLIVNASSAPGWISSYNANNFWIQAGLVVPIADLDTMSKGVTTHLMLFCFSIALAQLGIAHLVNIKAYLSTRSLKILSEIGKLGMLLGMYFVILSLVVFGQGFEGVTAWQLYSLAGGFVLVFIFDNYEGSIAKSIGVSLGNIISVVLGITNVFSDIMSYIRLWAVGLAGAAIAGMVNSFASPMMAKLAFFIFGLALFAFGHSFNMVLNVLSVLVHAIRLNTLEFSSHVGITWSGFAYKPFAKR
jgi:V/A-type H+-transporting ATPase subunit I